MFYKIDISKWDEAISLNNLLNSKSSIWAYRGHADSNWHLETKFERECQKHNFSSYFYRTCEKNIITSFKRQALQHIQNVPDSNNLIDWLAYIQHYGGPTRLLDFTYSFYVSAFFAAQSVKNIPSIWCINVNNLIKQNENLGILLDKIEYREILAKYADAANETLSKKQDFQDFNENQKKGNVYLIEPYNQEQRLGIQQGFFLFPTDIEMPFEKNLRDAFNVKEGGLSPEKLESKKYKEFLNIEGQEINCVQIVFTNKDVTYEAINQLRSMNISSATLFPGLDGFARSLDFHFYEMYYEIYKPKILKK